ncbi:MAG: hypothetical protein ABL868_06415 [Sulfuriferula sp.]
MTDNYVTEENHEIAGGSFTEEDYAELLDYYRQGCPDVPIELLAKFASIPWGSVIGTDPVDVVRVLSYPGEKLIFTENITDHGQWLAAANNICHQALEKGIDPTSTGCIVGLMIVKEAHISSFTIRDNYYPVRNNLLKLRKSTHEEGAVFLTVLLDELIEESSLTLVFSGVGVRDPLES